MNHPRICAVVTSTGVTNIKSALEMADLFELRIDRIGPLWTDIPPLLLKPWIATNRSVREGGGWTGEDESRTEELRRALRMGAAMVDIELGTPGLEAFVAEVKRDALCIVSYHDFTATPEAEVLNTIVHDQITAGADICKVVTTASTVADNLTVLQLYKQFPGVKLVSLAMGEAGRLSRLICPLAGGEFTFATIEAGGESAPGQMQLGDLRRLYQVMGYD